MTIWIDTAGADRACGLFGLAPLERHLRALAKRHPAQRIVLSGPEPALRGGLGPNVELRTEAGPAGARLAGFLREAEEGGKGGVQVIALDAGAVVDPRLIAHLLGSSGNRAAFGGSGRERAAVLALHPAEAERVPPDAPTVLAVAEAMADAGSVAVLSQEDFPSFVTNLRRSLPFYVFAVPDEETRRNREAWMFRSNYKGSTDFLTKWVYPPLVWQLVRLCTAWRIHPNWVTLLSLVLTAAVVPAFGAGLFWIGLLCAYAMSVLDSVDGKVARLTLTDSAVGNLLDHGMDIVHPPLWYAAWAWGLGARTPEDPLFLVAAWLIGFYVADRLVLMVAKAWFRRGLHAMTPLDGAIRTWIARRNTNLVILTVGLALGMPEAALVVVTAWQGLTLAWHAVRTTWLMARRAVPA